MSSSQKLKVAAVQMQAELANVDENLKKVESLIRYAVKQGASWVILPEFFTSACAFHPDMLKAILPINGKATELLKRLARELNAVIGGSFIALHEKDSYNSFILVFPNGDSYQHNKDIPTMWENCYYIGGEDDGVLDTKFGPVGAALCWEMLRTQTAKRLLGKVQFVVAGSCWWGLPDDASTKFNPLSKTSLEMLQATPVTFAKLLDVPVIHAGHAGNFEGYAAPSERRKYKSHYLGESKIVDRQGQVLAGMSYDDGEGVIIAEIDVNASCNPSMQIPKSFWISKMPKEFIKEWDKLNQHGLDYYQNQTFSYLQND